MADKAPLYPYVRQRKLMDRFWFDEIAILEEVYSHYNATRDPVDRPKVMAYRYSLVLIKRVTRMMRVVPEITEFQPYPAAGIVQVSKAMHMFFPVVMRYDSDQQRDDIHEHLRDLWFVSSNLVWEGLGEAMDSVTKIIKEMP